MANYTFDNTIPAAPNNPSDDQPDMLVNNQSNQSIWAEDHKGFNTANSGLHKQARIVNQLTIPPNLSSVTGVLYTKLASSQTPLTESNVFFSPGTSGNEYQLTRPITAKFALFGKNTNNYNAQGLIYSGGWTFLPGGLLFQYGKVFFAALSIPTQAIPVPFPLSFNTSPPFNIQVTYIATLALTANDATISVVDGSETATGFIANSSAFPTGAYVGFYWTAIGI